MTRARPTPETQGARGWDLDCAAGTLPDRRGAPSGTMSANGEQAFPGQARLPG